MDIFANSMDFLLWVKGPAFNIAIFIFVIGVIIRVFEIVLLGRKKDFAPARSSEIRGGLSSIISRTLPEKSVFKRSPFVIIMGYIWHIAWFVALLLFIPHIEVFKDLTGISWPGLPNQIIDIATIIAIVSLIAILINRLNHPVLRFISTKEDYLVWLMTFLPVLTGFMAFHHFLEPYNVILGLHILSVELFLIIFPFTKLMHAITLFMARWYNGAINGRKQYVGDASKTEQNKELKS